MRSLLFLITLAGCDQVWGLERTDAPPPSDNNDEDKDGTVNSLDRCPHLDDRDQTDTDKDGIPAICDADDANPDTVAVFFGFDDEGIPSALEVQGVITSDDPGSVSFGRTSDGLDTITLKNVSAKTALIDVGYDVLASSVEEGRATSYAEMGLYTANTSYSSATRGDVCFHGIVPPATQPNQLYTELVENAGIHKQTATMGALAGSRGRMRLLRTPEKYTCDVFRTGMGTLSDSQAVEALQQVPGRIGFSTERVHVRLRYIYIAYQSLTPL